MNAKSVALVAMFAAIAIALNTIRIPTVFWPGIYYSFYEIPVLVAFLLFGVKIGFLVEALHVTGQLIFFPVGTLGFAGYPMGFVAMLLTFGGIYLASRVITRKSATGNPISGKKEMIYFTAFAVAFRGGIMPFLDYLVMYHILLPLVLGIAIPEAYIAALVPSFVLFNLTASLFAVLIAYVIATKVSKSLKIEPRIFRLV